MSRHSPCACALDVPFGTSRDIGAASYVFHDPEEIYNPPRADRPPPPIWRQLLTDIAWTVIVLGAVIVTIVLSNLSRPPRPLPGRPRCPASSGSPRGSSNAATSAARCGAPPTGTPPEQRGLNPRRRWSSMGHSHRPKDPHARAHPNRDRRARRSSQRRTRSTRHRRTPSPRTARDAEPAPCDRHINPNATYHAEGASYFTDAQGRYPAQGPPKYHVVKEITGDNSGKPISAGTTYRLQPAGTGMLYRFACNDARLDTGRYFSSTAGTVRGDWQPDSYVTAAAHNERSGAYYFDWNWLASGIASQPRAIITFYGDCKWEARIINVTM